MTKPPIEDLLDMAQDLRAAASDQLNAWGRAHPEHQPTLANVRKGITVLRGLAALAEVVLNEVAQGQDEDHGSDPRDSA